MTNELTQEQVESAAREYCRLSGLNPDKIVAHGADPDERGFVPAILLHSPLWKRIARPIVEQDRLRRAIDSVRSGSDGG